MNKDIRWIALTKSLIYVAASVGIGEMLGSESNIASIMLALACMISLVFDLNTW